MLVKTRDISIDIVKFFAVFLIINSHADICYPKYSVLATGGAIGDALFLFCSGYTLWGGEFKAFDNWYKRRINRIYPSVFACIIVAIVLGFMSMKDLSFLKISGGEFVIAIMIYYVLLYLIQRFFIDKLSWVLWLTIITTLIAYYFFPYKLETGSKGIYGVTTSFRWIPYFGIMLMGAWVGFIRKKRKRAIIAKWTDFILMFVCIFLFYGIQLMAKKNSEIGALQIITFPFLAGIVYYFWKCCNMDCFKCIYNSRAGNWTIMAVSGLCLESYLIQLYLFTDKLNWLFPFNILLIMLVILVVSYICRCIARVISQTFRTEDYEWKKVFSIK